MTQQEIIDENLLHKHMCILNFNTIDLDSPVYRVYSIDRLIQLLQNKKNALVKPILWDDPFENVIFQQTATTSNGQELSFEDLQESFYGQCWTLNTNETDALWRIYSPNKNGVRVKTTIRKLFDGFYNPAYQWAMLSYYIGKIIYETSDNIQKYFEDPDNLQMIFDTSGEGSIQTLLIKRMEFEHENEIRLIYTNNGTDADTTQKIYEYDIDTNILIDELLFDPRFDEVDDYKKKTDEIRKLGYINAIDKSKLYQLPKFNLRIKD